MESEAAITAHAIDTVRQSFDRLADGSSEGLAELYSPDAVNHEAESEPPLARVTGPDAFLATSSWLRAAFSDLRFTIEAIVVDGEQVVVRNTMHGRHTADFATWQPDGSLDVFPATDRCFTQRQMHWFTLRDGRITEHRAQRDDLGMARQLNWIPPTPRYLLRMARARRRSARVDSKPHLAAH